MREYRFRSAVSGLYYDHPGAAGDIDVIECDGCKYSTGLGEKDVDMERAWLAEVTARETRAINAEEQVERLQREHLDLLALVHRRLYSWHNRPDCLREEDVSDLITKVEAALDPLLADALEKRKRALPTEGTGQGVKEVL